MLFKCKKPVEVAKKAFYLAYLASGAFGLGNVRRTSQSQPNTEDQVFEALDSTGTACLWHADYIQGRMIKFGCALCSEGLVIDDDIPRPDYQSWSRQYPTYTDLFEAAVKHVESDEAAAEAATSDS